MSKSKAPVVEVCVCTGNDKKWSVCVYVPNRGLYVVSASHRTKSDAIPAFRLVRDHLRNTMDVARVAAVMAKAAIAKAKGEQ